MPARARLRNGRVRTDTAEDPDDDPATARCDSIELGFCAEPAAVD